MYNYVLLLTFLASSENSESLERAFSQTTVVIACAGPFAWIGTPIVDACIKTGTHYCDITGTKDFQKRQE